MSHSEDDTYLQEDISVNNSSELTNYPDSNFSQLRQRRHSLDSSRSSDFTECTVRTGSTQSKIENEPDACLDRDSWMNEFTFDDSWCSLNMAESSSSARPLQPRNQCLVPNQEQTLLFPHQNITQTTPTARLYEKPTHPLETMPENLDVPFHSSRKAKSSLVNTQLGVSAELLQDQFNGPGLQPSLLSLQGSPSFPNALPKHIPLPPARKRPPLPSKPWQGKPHHKLPTEAQGCHQGQVQPIKSLVATGESGRPIPPPKPINEYLTLLPPPICIQENHHLVLPPKPKLDKQQPLLPPKPKLDKQQPLLPPKPQTDDHHLVLPPKPTPRNDHQPTSVPQRPPPNLPPRGTNAPMPTVQSPPVEQLSISVSHERQQPTPTMASTSEEIPESIAPRTPRSQTSNRSTSAQRLRHTRRRAHFLLSRRNLLIASFSSVLLSLVSMSLLIVIKLDPFSYNWRDLTFKERAYKTCVKCLYLIQDLTSDLSNPDFKDLVNEPRDGDMYCCATTSKQMRALLKLILRQQKYTPNHDDLPEPALSSAHIHLIPGDLKSNIIGDGHSLMRMTLTPDRTSHEHSKSITVGKHGYKIESDGFYYVYSSIVYQRKHTSCKNDKFKTMEHKIILVRPSNTPDSGSLARTAHTCCTNCSDEGKQSSFAGGIFMLLEGDQIAASITHVNDVKYGESSYLGVVMLGK